MTDLVDELRTLAEELARAAGTLAADGRRRLGASPVDQIAKSTPTDPVTEYDRAAEAAIVEVLVARRPDDAIVGEEGTGREGSSGLSWLVDPIDGTVNFVYDLPGWSTSIGVCDRDGPLAGAVFAPLAGEMFSAARGRGATRNGEPIRCTAAADAATALVATGFAYDTTRRAAQGRRVAELLPAVRDIRRFGSAALDLCMVACGRVDAYFEEHLNPWDLAAGVLVATEAGAVATDFAGGPVRPAEVLVAAPGVHEALRQLIASIDAARPG